MNNGAIHTAYAVTRRHGVTSYRAVALVTDKAWKGYNARVLGIGDTAAEAIREAVDYVHQTYRRDGLALPAGERVDHGRVCGMDLDHNTWARRIWA